MLTFRFQPFPELNTERLILRKMNSQDIPEIFFLRSDESVMKYVNREPALSYKDVEDFLDRIDKSLAVNETIIWGIALKENPAQLIGNICIWRISNQDHRAEIGYVLHPGYWRKGYARESIVMVVQYGFEEMKLHSLEAHISPENIASAAVLEATGFVKEAYLKDNIRFRDEYLNTIIYSKLNGLD
jgi:[ribosomal protein S5]-alanine N-acetyltransferase